jgi:hypothetical protein
MLLRLMERSCAASSRLTRSFASDATTIPAVAFLFVLLILGISAPSQRRVQLDCALWVNSERDAEPRFNEFRPV